MPGEGMDQRAPVSAKAGSLIVWDGNLWHGAFGRKRPGVRVALSVTFMRPHLRTFENYVANATPEILARNPPRFAQIIGKHINVGWTDHQGPRGGDVGLTVGRHIYE
jgi:ectoine hydroxylase-related dioxygenase (phytanoyl-CoA dioxygenase family)